jgi:hypothetical protein
MTGKLLKIENQQTLVAQDQLEAEQTEDDATTRL